MSNATWKYFIGVLFLALAVVWFVAITYPDDNLHLIACDVGQGDSVLITHKTNQILIDGGPGRDVLGCLSDNLPFWDRNIEMVILTHPQLDHFGGLIEVLSRYKVEYFVTTGLGNSTQDYEALEKAVGGSGAGVVFAKSGQVYRLGMIHLDILHPNGAFLTSNSVSEQKKQSRVLGVRTTSRDLNDFSIVASLSFGEFDALLTGDMGPDISYQLIESNLIKDLEYIKIPHHGSKNGLTDNLLKSSTPEIAVISVGEGNSYGHPHKMVLDLLIENGVKLYRTDESGDIEIVTDGKNWWVVE